jgi:signal transduction histidine kinase
VVAPLTHAGRVYGALLAERATAAGPFDGRHVALLQGIARQVGMALDNLRLLDDERNAAALATTLLEVAREFNQAVELSVLLGRLAARAVELTGASAALIALWRPRDRAYRIDAVQGGEASVSALRDVQLGSDAYRPGVDGVRLDPEYCQRFAGALGVEGAVTDVSVLMERGGEMAGMLTLLWGAGREPSGRQVALARGLAYQAAIALQNVQLLENLREASRLKSEFVATMSHELRTPLNVIMGYTNLFIEEGFGPLTERQRGVLARMQRSASELFDLVTATLDLNRLEAGKSRVRVEPVGINELFTQLEAETTTRPEAANLELKWEVAPNLPSVETDRAKLRIVLKNLVGNALKFTEKGSITVTAEPGADGTVVFTVADTGIGIKREDLPVIFEMFRQVEPSSTRKFGGVGLGLYIVKRLLGELRGEVDVQSEFGVGSRFRVRVPVALAPTEAVPTAEAS